jgi:dipeptidyl aminopeptidase/acylaminoacyl peptidase
MTKMVRVLGGLFFLVTQLAMGQDASTVSIEQALNLKSVSSPRISPDGRLIAYTVNETNWEENAYETEVWIAVVATADNYQLTNAKKSSSNPQWSPDGKWIAFTSDRDGKNQLYLIRPAGGEARQITKHEQGVNSFHWAPDGRSIAFTSTDAESKAMKDRKEKYGDYEVVDREYQMTHLWLLSLPADMNDSIPKPKKFTKGSSYTVAGFSWSPDSKRIAFSATKDPLLSDSYTGDIYVLTLSDTTVKKIVDTPGPDGSPEWSPDGKSIAYVTSNAQEFYYYRNNRLAVIPAEGGTPRILSESFDEDLSLLEWGADGIYFSALQKTASHLYRINPASKKTDRLSNPDNLAAQSFSFARDYQSAAFVSALPNEYNEISISTLKSFAVKKLTKMSNQLKDFKLARREVIEWKSSDGTSIEGVLIKPSDFDPSKKYPLLVIIHGGPTGVDRPTVNADRTYPVEMFSAKGALILRPNYRGSAGYGEKFRSLNVRNLGVGDYWDVISGVDFLIGKGMVDRERVGAMGWSEGGYISAFITTFSDRFKAVSIGAGISDWMTYYVNTDIHPFTRQYLKATPWDDPEIYRKTSPITYINTAKTPTLIQHGELDRRVPIPNGYELYQALQDKGVPVKMVVYKGFGHGITKPKQMRAVMEENYNWFSRYIWGEKTERAEK